MAAVAGSVAVRIVLAIVPTATLAASQRRRRDRLCREEHIGGLRVEWTTLGQSPKLLLSGAQPSLVAPQRDMLPHDASQCGASDPRDRRVQAGCRHDQPRRIGPLT